MNKIIPAIIFTLIFLVHMYWGVFSTYEFITGDSKFAFAMLTSFWGCVAGFFVLRCELLFK